MRRIATVTTDTGGAERIPRHDLMPGAKLAMWAPSTRQTLSSLTEAQVAERVRRDQEALTLRRAAVAAPVVALPKPVTARPLRYLGSTQAPTYGPERPARFRWDAATKSAVRV